MAMAVALPCGLLSPFLVLRGWSLMGDAISHAVLPGIVLAWLAGLPLLAGAFVAGLSSSILTGWLETNSRIKRDTLMGVVFSAMFAVGIVLISVYPVGIHLDQILFGDLLGVSVQDMWTTASIGLAITAFVALKWRALMLMIFDETQARALGLPVTVLHFSLLAMISAAVVAAMSAVGIILVIALLITPGAAATLLAKRFGVTLALSCALALVTSVLGVYLSFWWNAAPAPTIVVTLTFAFLLALSGTIVQSQKNARSK